METLKLQGHCRGKALISYRERISTEGCRQGPWWRYSAWAVILGSYNWPRQYLRPGALVESKLVLHTPSGDDRDMS